ncbi:ras GTPase-activating protein-binding protein 2 [Bombyx mandarina]|uniref:Ras GTPase-activating protein-binding protein 2 n=2 Tax=Bombyx TaxID=7090 RepID=A0A8R2QW20_BOMMO|nr:ras GTPase-activating protein-binding protein 2 [Bombyx mandarina]XP_037867474.1 ras GTPase-activating protein-binding protein 2 [Bombyx mori]
MVMEASPSPQSVGREFVRQYYTLLNKAPAHLHRFYNNYSSFIHGGLDAPNRETLPVVGQKQIHNRIQQLNFRDCHAKISQVDAQATLGNGVVVQVTGELSNGGAPMRRFTQTFVLAAQSPKKYYVHNDIFRYQDIVFSDEEGEGSGRSEGEEEESAANAGAYFPPPPNAFPSAPFPQPPHAPLVSPPPPAPAPPAPQQPAHHLNGHPQQHDDVSRHLVAALQATTAPSEPEPERSATPPPAPAPLDAAPEPEPEREPTPPPQPATVPPEPKTYANLLKSGSSQAQRAMPAVVPSSAPPRAPRPAPPPGLPPAPEAARRYSDAQQLFLGNLPPGASEDELRALFAQFGPVAELRVHAKSAPPGQPRLPNYGFITYESSQAASECLSAAPLYFPPDSADAVKLNVEEKKARGREPPPRARRPPSSARAPRPAYRR